MNLLKGFKGIVVLLVTLSFLLLAYNYLIKFWREGYGNLGTYKCGSLSCWSDQACLGGEESNSPYSCGARGSRGGGAAGGGGGGAGGGRDHHHERHGRHRQDKINCRKPKHGIAKNGRPHGWKKECIVPPGIPLDENGFSSYKLCGGQIDKYQEEKGHFHEHCRKRWKVTSKGEVTLVSPSTHGYKHKARHHFPYETPRTFRTDGNHRYKKWIPDHLDHKHITQSDYEQIGKKFIEDEAHSRDIQAPPVHDSEAEILGRLVWRVYVAEIKQKQSNSPKNQEEVLDHEISLLDKVSQILPKQQFGSNKGGSIVQCAKEVNGRYLSNNYTHGRTSNMFGHHDESVQRKVGHAFEGRPLHGAPAYSDANLAIAHCQEDRACGGINYNTYTHRYELMPKDARIVKRHDMVAYIKDHGHAARKKHRHSRHGHDGHHDDWRHHDDRCHDKRRHHDNWRHDKRRHHDDWHHNKRRHHDDWHHDDWKHPRRSYQKNEYAHQWHERTPPHYGSRFSQDGAHTPWQPRDPNLKPRPYNSLMDLFS